MDQNNNENKRYFILAYEFQSPTAGSGNCGWDTSDNQYVNFEMVKKTLYNRSGIKNITILNIIEVTKDDHDVFIYKQSQ